MLRTTGGMAAIVVATLLLTGCSGSKHPSVQYPSARHTTPPSANHLIVMIGDSIMRGYGLAPNDLAWPQLLAEDRDLTIDNLACDGAGFLAVGAPTECNSSYESIVLAAIDLHPATVFIEGSDNDFGQESTELATATTRQIQQLRAALPDATIIGLSTISGAAADPAQLAATDSRVKQAIDSVHGRYLTVGQPYSQNAAWMQDDQEHPTSAGQLAIKQAVERALDAAHITLR